MTDAANKHATDRARFAARAEIVDQQHAASALLMPYLAEVIADLGPGATEDDVFEEVMRRLQDDPEVVRAMGMAAITAEVNEAIQDVAVPRIEEDGTVVWVPKDQVNV